MRTDGLRATPRRFRVGLVVVAALAVVAAGVVTSVWNARASAEAAPRSSFVPIKEVRPVARAPQAGPNGSTGVFTVDCGTNGNRKLSPDNPVAQPGVKNGAQHVHDFVGNLSISAESSDASLAESGTTCRNGDRSSYFWPVVRIDRKANVVPPKLSGTPVVSCPNVSDRLPAVPTAARSEVNRNLSLLDEQIAEANRRLAAAAGQGGPDFVNNAILGPLRDKRIATIDRIAIAIGRVGARPTGLGSLADCDLSYDGAHAGHAGHRTTGGAGNAGTSPTATPTVSCPSVRTRVPGVPTAALDEVNRNLDLLDRQIAEANERLVATQGQGGPGFVDNAILGPLRDKRIATIDRIVIAIGRTGTRPTALETLAPCTLSTAGAGTPGASASAAPTASDLPGVAGPNLEIAGNVGGIVRPAGVTIEYRGNAVSGVVPMPMFLKAIVGDAKPTSRGPANARASWTCSGFTDRLSAKYVICPRGSKVMRVHNFASCWDGRNTDSANHRDHLKFADPTTGACPAGTVAVPQLRITIAYDIPRDVQKKGQYQLDSFPEENHNPFSDHNDFVNVNSVETMARIAACINSGGRCR